MTDSCRQNLLTSLSMASHRRSPQLRSGERGVILLCEDGLVRIGASCVGSALPPAQRLTEPPTPPSPQIRKVRRPLHAPVFGLDLVAARRFPALACDPPDPDRVALDASCETRHDSRDTHGDAPLSVHARLFTPAASLTRPPLRTTLRRSRDTMKVTLNTRTDLKTSSAELRVFDVKASTTLDGFKILTAAKPSVLKLQLDGEDHPPPLVRRRRLQRRDRQERHHRLLDNLQLVPDGSPSASRSLLPSSSGDVSPSPIAEYAKEGNTANGAIPSAKDVVTINVKGPKVAVGPCEGVHRTDPRARASRPPGRWLRRRRGQGGARGEGRRRRHRSGRCLCRRAPRRNSG